MATATEIENLVVRMSADIGGLLTGYNQVVQQSTSTAKAVEDSAIRIEGLTGKFRALVGTAVATLGALGINNFLQEAKGEWQAAETAAFRLSAVIKAQGGNVKELMEDYNEFAAQIQKNTTYSDEYVLSLAKTAESFDLSGAAAKKAIRDALALGAVTGQDAQGMVRLTAAMAKGDEETARRFARMVPQLRGVKEHSEFIEKYQKLVVAGNQTMIDELSTGAGKAANFANQWSDAMEEVGKIFTELSNPIKVVKSLLLDLWSGLPEGTKKIIVFTAAAVAGFVGLSAAITTAGIVFNTLFGGVGLIIGAVVTLATGTGVLIAQTEAAGHAWAHIKERAVEFWQWLKPIRQALESLGSFLWEAISAGWSMLVDKVSRVWMYITDVSHVNWGKIREYAVDAILLVQFSLTNLGKIGSAVWSEMKFHAMTAVNDIAFLFTDKLPAVFKWFKSNLRSIISAEGDVSPLFLPSRKLTDAELNAFKEFTKKYADLQKQWLDFRAAKLAEFAADTSATDQVAKNLEDGFVAPIKEATKQLEKFDAALHGSAEARGRLLSFLGDTFDSKKKLPVGAGNVHAAEAAGMPLGGVGPMPRVVGELAHASGAAGIAGAYPALGIIGLLARIAKAVETTADKPALAFGEAGLDR